MCTQFYIFWHSALGALRLGGVLWSLGCWCVYIVRKILTFGIVPWSKQINFTSLSVSVVAKCISRPMIIWAQFHTFWPPCRFVTTVQSILNLAFTCLWFWRLRSFHYGTLSHLCFLATVSLSLAFGFFNGTPAVDLYHQFFRCWRSRSMRINSSIDSEILDVRAVH